MRPPPIRLVLDGVSKRYGEVAALADVSLAVADRSRTAIVGPSGSGKSTLLRLVAGFEAPDRGRILLDGRALADGPAIVPPHRREIGIVAQDGALFPHLTVADNIAFGLERGTADRAGRVRALAAAVELDEGLLRRHPHEVSGGQQQRVALARALGRRPRLMLLDEPFSALDAGLRETTRRSVAAILEAHGVPCILVTHDQTEALSFADQVAVLHDGRLLEVGSPRDLYLTPRNRRTAEFLGEMLVLPAEIRGGEARCRLGRLAVGGGARPGPADIMLRPEQIGLAPLADTVARPGACVGRVAGLAFAGALSSVTVDLESAGDAGPTSIVLRILSTDLPAIGDRVRLDVRGAAHVLPDSSGRGR